MQLLEQQEVKLNLLTHETSSRSLNYTLQVENDKPQNLDRDTSLDQKSPTKHIPNHKHRQSRERMYNIQAQKDFACTTGI